MKKCYYCGQEIEDNADFCTKCGNELPDSTCPQCGADVDDNDNYCQNCGYDLANDEGVVVEENSGNGGGIDDMIGEESQTPNSFKLLVIGIILALLLGGGWYSYKTMSNNSVSQSALNPDSIGEAVDSIIDDVNSEVSIKQRLNEICLAYNDPNFSEEKTIEQYFSTEFRKMYNTISELEKSGKGGDGLWYSGGFLDGSSEGVDNMSVGEIHNINENKAIVDFVYHSGGSKYTKTANLVLEDGNWFVDDICNRKSDMREYIDYMMEEEIAVADTVAADSAAY